MNKAEDIVAILDESLFNWAYKQIEQASVQGSAKLAGFILGACFIDAMASFYFGVNHKTKKTSAGKRFKEFVEIYLPKYDKEKLWEDLRCGLVHSYSAGNAYLFTDDNKAGFHFDETPKGAIILNLEDFCADLRQAYRSFRKDIISDPDIFKNVIRRYKSMGIMVLAIKEDC